MIKEKLEIVKKAWSINPSNLWEGYFANTDEIYYGTRGQAKSLALLDHDAMKTDNGEDLSFLTIRMSRRKEYDKIIFRDALMSKKYMNKIIEMEMRDDKFSQLLKNNPKSKAFIHCYRGYYRWNMCGYTYNKLEAGVYDLSVAVKHSKGTQLDKGLEPILINVEEYNFLINEKIKKIKHQLI